jgi:hypothetical protein
VDRDLVLVERLEPGLGRLEVELRPPCLAPDLELVRVGVALRMPVEQPAEECAARALDLRDEHHGLADLHDVVGADLTELPVLLELVQLLPQRALHYCLRL